VTGGEPRSAREAAEARVAAVAWPTDGYRRAALTGVDVALDESAKHWGAELAELRRQLAEVTADRDEHRRLRTLGGPPPPFVQQWQRGTVLPAQQLGVHADYAEVLPERTGLGSDETARAAGSTEPG
jgi:hypothetical protein